MSSASVASINTTLSTLRACTTLFQSSRDPSAAEVSSAAGPCAAESSAGLSRQPSSGEGWAVFAIAADSRCRMQRGSSTGSTFLKTKKIESCAFARQSLFVRFYPHCYTASYTSCLVKQPMTSQQYCTDHRRYTCCEQRRESFVCVKTT